MLWKAPEDEAQIELTNRVKAYKEANHFARTTTRLTRQIAYFWICLFSFEWDWRDVWIVCVCVCVWAAPTKPPSLRQGSCSLCTLVVSFEARTSDSCLTIMQCSSSIMPIEDARASFAFLSSKIFSALASSSYSWFFRSIPSKSASYLPSLH